jgi:amidase
MNRVISAVNAQGSENVGRVHELAGRGLPRRAFLKKAGLVTGAIAAAPILSSVLPAAMPTAKKPELLGMDAVGLSKRIKAKEVSCREVMDAFLSHIDRINPVVNAIVSLQDREALLEQADERDAQLKRGEYLGWLHGFPQAIKDLTATKGIRTTQGSPLLKNFFPQADAFLVERMKKSGAIIIGKTNTPEFGLGSQTYNNVFGTTLNAYDQKKTAGGSSGGAAVSVALCMQAVADGTDFFGSLRNPPAFNNVFGLRPSYGRVPAGPAEEIFVAQLSVPGPIGRTVSDVALLLSIMAGHDSRSPLSIEQDPGVFLEPLKRDFDGTRIAWLGNFGGYLAMEPGVLDLCEDSFKIFESIGCKIEDTQPDFPPEKNWATFVTLRHWLRAGNLGHFYDDPAQREQMKPEAQWEVEGGLRLSAMDAYKASANRSSLYQVINRLFTTYDYLLLPTAQVFPFDADVHWPQEIDGKKMDTYDRWMEVCLFATLIGSPAINVPVGFKDGLPMGMQIIGRNHADLAVLQLAYSYEQATQWVSKHPPPLLTQAS